jgi:hypothetical protein
MRRGTYLLVLITMLFGMSFAGVAAQDATPAADTEGPSLLADLGFPELALTTDGETIELPSEIEAGRYYVTLANTGSELSADIELFQLPEGITIDDLLAAFEEEDIPDWFFDLVGGGGVTTAPGGSGGAILDLTPGEWIFNLFTYDEGFATQNDQPFEVSVTGEMPAVEDPEAAVEASMVDFDFELSGPVPAGPSVWKIVNDGTQPHHLIAGQVPEGTTEEQVVEVVSAFFGPPASPEAATPEAVASPVEEGLSFDDFVDAFETPILTSGRAMWIEVDLEPGTYTAICFLPTPDGTPHVMLGMVEIFTVE